MVNLTNALKDTLHVNGKTKRTKGTEERMCDTLLKSAAVVVDFGLQVHVCLTLSYCQGPFTIVQLKNRLGGIRYSAIRECLVNADEGLTGLYLIQIVSLLFVAAPLLLTSFPCLLLMRLLGRC